MGLASASRNRLRTHQAARLLGISTQALRRLVDKGELPAEKVRGRYIFSRAALEARLARSKGHAGSAPLTDGQIDAEAVRMLDAGKTDAEVIAALELPLERLERIHRARGDAPPPEPRGGGALLVRKRPSTAPLEDDSPGRRMLDRLLAKRGLR